MSGIDIALIAILVFGAISGYREGFLMELFSFVAIILGILGAFKLLGLSMVFLAERFEIDEKVLPYVAFGVVFLAIVILVKVFANMIKLSIDKSFLGKVDQAAGAVLGLFKTFFLLSVALWIVDSLKVQLPERWTENSVVLPRVAGFAPWLTSWISEIFPFFDDIF